MCAEARTAEVHEYQRQYGMTPRPDSKLTLLYARGDTALRADEVARELVCVDYLYGTTLYGEILEGYMREVAALLRRAFHGLSWTDTWRIVAFYAPIALRLQMVSACGIRMPQLGARLVYRHAAC